jgi:hypothetical protein
MRTEFLDLIGATIAGIVIKEGPSSPTMQVFLLLDGARHFEFYIGAGRVAAVENPRLHDNMDLLVVGVMSTSGSDRLATAGGSARPCSCRTRVHVSPGPKPKDELCFSNLPGAVGRTITAILNRQTSHGPNALTLALDDNTFIEVISYEDPVRGCGRIDKGDLEKVLAQFGPEWKVLFACIAPELGLHVN